MSQVVKNSGWPPRRFDIFSIEALLSGRSANRNSTVLSSLVLQSMYQSVAWYIWDNYAIQEDLSIYWLDGCTGRRYSWRLLVHKCYSPSWTVMSQGIGWWHLEWKWPLIHRWGFKHLGYIHYIFEQFVPWLLILNGHLVVFYLNLATITDTQVVYEPRGNKYNTY